MTGSGGVDTGVQATAYLAAACRAAEAGRPRPRLRDDLAHRFVAARPAGLPDYQQLLAAGGAEVVARTVLLDELLGLALAGSDRPVLVNLGAGFCTRPYRLDLSACAVVLELDAAPVLAVKAEVLTGHRPVCRVERVPLDLRDHRALAETLTQWCAGADRVVVLSEGLLPYLPQAEIAGLAGTLADAVGPAAGQAGRHAGEVAGGQAVWLADVVSSESAAGMTQLARAANAGLALSGLDTLAPLEGSGWVTTDYRILPVARRQPPGWPAARPRQTSHQVVDGVLALRRR